MMDDRMRASDADRERATTRLREHFAEGRLTPDELDERITATLGAKTCGDLRRIMADLPEPAPAAREAGRPRPDYPARAYRRGPRLLPLALLMLFVAVIAPGAGFVFFAVFKVLLLVWLVACVAGAFAALRFRRRARRYWRSGYGSPWHQWQ